MKKDAYYFSHDANARNDHKVLKLRRQTGLEGYGIYWCLVEMLRESPTYKLPLNAIDDIAYELHCDGKLVRDIVMHYELFEMDEQEFFSARLLRSMEDYNTLKNRLSEAGRKGGLSRAKAEVKHPPSIKGKESKVKEIKVNEIKVNKREVFTPPEFLDVENYFFDNYDGLDAKQQAERFFNHFTANGWKIGGRAPMKDWKAAARNWMSRSAEFKPKGQTSKVETALTAYNEALKNLNNGNY